MPILSFGLLLLVVVVMVWGAAVVNAQTSSPTTPQPTAAQPLVGNTCSACTTASCVYYRHAYGPNVQEVTMGCASPTLSPSCVVQSGNFGVGASGLYSFGGASTQVNIASTSPSGAGATGKLNLGANTGTPTSQEINLGATTDGVIRVGGSASTNDVGGSSAASTTIINKTPWNTWGWWILTTSQTVTAGAMISFSSAATSPSPTASTVQTSWNTNAPTSLSSGRAIILGNCRAFVTNTGPATYFPAAAPTTVIFPGATTQPPAAPTAQPVTYSGDCVYVQRAGLYRYELTIEGATPTPSPSVIDNVQFSSVYSPVASSPTPGTLAANTYYLPMTKDGSSNAYRSSFSQTYPCEAAPCLFMSILNTPAASVAVTAYRTTLTVMDLKSN